MTPRGPLARAIRRTPVGVLRSNGVDRVRGTGRILGVVALWLAAALRVGAIGVASLLGLAAQATDPQTSDAPAKAIFGRVVDGKGHALPDAEVWIVAVAPWRIADLTRTTIAHEASPAPIAVRTTVDGRFSIRGVERAHLVVRHSSGLGAVVLDATAGVPERVEALPMSAVDGLGDGPVAVALDGTDRPRFVAGLRGPRVVLPAGTFRLLGGTPVADHRVQLRSGTATTVVHPGSPWRTSLRLRDDATLFLVAWPDAPLLRDGDDWIVPRSEGPPTLATRTPLATGVRYAVASLAAELDPVAEPQLARVVLRNDADAPIVGARVWTLALPAAGPELVFASRSDALGVAHVDRSAARHRVIVHANGHAVAALDDLPVGATPVITLVPEVAFEALVRAADGRALGAVAVHVVPETTGRAGVVAHTDRRGHVALGGLGAGVVRIRAFADGHSFDEREVRLPQTSELVLTARPGVALTGRVFVDGTRPAEGAVVALRAPSRTSAVDRTTATDADGRFRFDGLPGDVTFVVSASLERGAHTWSGRIVGAQPGSDEWRIDLRHEDPPPPGGGRIR